MLRREAEELQRKMEQLIPQPAGRSRNLGSRNRGSRNRGNRNGAAAVGPDGRQSGQGGQMSSQQLQRAIEQLRQAQQDMRQSTSSARAKRIRAARRNGCSRPAICLPDCVNSRPPAAWTISRARPNRWPAASRNPIQNAKGIRRARASRQAQGAYAASRPRNWRARRSRSANDYQHLETEMGTAARDTRATNRQLSSKLRDALGQVQQNEINNRLRQSADWLRTGRGGPATMRDAVTTQA